MSGRPPVYILTVDQSTTGTKAVLVDREGTIRYRHALPHRQHYPHEGWVEHDPLELYANAKAAMLGVMRQAGVTGRQLVGMTVTNQRETALLWDRESGLPAGNAIVWQCRRTAAFCDRLKREGCEPFVRAKSGLPLDPYFSAGKWRWLLEHRTEGIPPDRLLAGTVDSWLLWKLTGGRVHATDYTNASRTQLFDIHTLEWDPELAALFGIPLGLLPAVYDSDRIYGHVADRELFPEPVPIAGVIGDSQAALFGQQCTRPGMAKGTYGTGTSVMMHAGGRPPSAENGLVAAIAWGKGGAVEYALEAVIHSTGDCLNWAKEQLGLFRTYEELEREIGSLDGAGGVYLVPAFVGLGAPHWNPHARAAIVGMNRLSGRNDILRAAVESIAYQVGDAVALLERAAGSKLRTLRVDGGATANRHLMQFQADVLGAEVVCPASAELSALGSAYMGGLAFGLWGGAEELGALYRGARTYAPMMEASRRSRLKLGWRAAVTGVLAAEQALREPATSE